ncbi:MAG TPA: hypothetical protein VI544_02635 [Candidatus Nanoarchaeia archaeon]|nr:hypothetical protein [Candidatus Nanoarchaeia archaeon]
MVNKKGILKILEASISILIIFGVILSFAMIRKTNSERDLSKEITPLLEEIAKNNTLREEIITDPENANASVLTFIASRIKDPNIGYNTVICEINETCAPDYPIDITGNLYAGSRVISSSLFGGSEGAKSKKVNIFLWIKS